MNTTVSLPGITRRLRSRPARLSAAMAGLLAATGAAVGLIDVGGSPDLSLSERPTPAPVQAWPGTLIESERAAVAAALAAPDARTRRLAETVAGGEAGTSALADPAILHHHGVDTSATAAHGARGTAERFHHR